LWRGVACLIVVLMHAISYAPWYQAIIGKAPLPELQTTADRVALLMHKAIACLWIGVPMFFVISGYCITATVDSMARRQGRLSEYFYRRFRRIYPPYWIACGAALLIVLACQLAPWPGLYSDDEVASYLPGALSASQWLGNLTLTESWRQNVAGDPQLYFLGTAWTLCYEEQFYALAGLILLCWPRRIFQAAIGITLASLAARIGARALGLRIDGFFFDGYWLQFAAGILVYYRINYATPRGGRWINLALGSAALAGLVFSGYLPERVDKWTAVALAFAWLISVIHPLDRWLTTSRLCAPLRYCGRLCYSMYLVHWPVTKVVGQSMLLAGFDGPWQTLLVTVPLGTVLSIAAAAVFYNFVERRCLNAPYVGGQSLGGGLSLRLPARAT
jgi:peptidoglycan/LPS O-acetylase OafA/YrhL